MSRRRPYPRDAIGPRLRPLLSVVLVLFALLTVNAVYLSAVSLTEYLTGRSLQDGFFQFMFLGHVGLGLLLLLPAVVYILGHYRRAHRRPNRRAVRAGQAMAGVTIAMLISGVVLTRGLPGVGLTDGDARELVYWLHVITPLLVVWLFVLHRLAGKAIAWRRGAFVGALSLAVAGVGAGALWWLQQPVAVPAGEGYFFPSLARTTGDELIPASDLMTDNYCAECHADTHERWRHSAHHFSSFNNPAYLFSVRETRRKLLARDGSIQGARFCAGCHDPVPFFSGAFDNPDYDDVNDPTAHAGITCVSCHAIEQINSPRGNADYTLGRPGYYPFTFSDNPVLAWTNRFLVRANPGFHKRSFLKPLHQEAEFCGSCHKVHLPPELNDYRWLRGQNHYDSFLLSGVSGVSVSSFYYPAKAEPNCNGCHMPYRPSDDFGARTVAGQDQSVVHDHLFASGNSALTKLKDLPGSVLDAHREMLEDSVTIDLFGLREANIDGAQQAPLGAEPVTLTPGATYVLELVLRTRTLGHLFTQGTADSNQVWVELVLLHNDEPVAISGAVNSAGEVDPAAHFVNAFVLDREGRRIDRRNAEEIFTSLYNHQIPPGAADVVHYRFTVPPTLLGDLKLRARLRYRKFDSNYYRLFAEAPEARNPLPVIDIASAAWSPAAPTEGEDSWRRWNDYGIGLLRKPGTGALRQAESAFQRVRELTGSGHGELNLARVYLREGRTQEAARVLEAASALELAYPWVHQWLTAQLDLQNGFVRRAVESLQSLTTTPYPQVRAMKGLGFDHDYRLWETLAGALYDLSRLERDAEQATLQRSRDAYERVLALEPERASTHYALSRVWGALGNEEKARYHAEEHGRYRVDDNARDEVIRRARARYPEASRAAEAVPVYPLRFEQMLIAEDE
ncbi:MAG: multiheme c-type cytochrome [Pseudomonadota bacterium]